MIKKKSLCGRPTGHNFGLIDVAKLLDVVVHLLHCVTHLMLYVFLQTVAFTMD